MAPAVKIGLPNEFGGVVYRHKAPSVGNLHMHALAVAREEAQSDRVRAEGLTGETMSPVCGFTLPIRRTVRSEKAAIALGLGEKNA